MAESKRQLSKFTAVFAGGTLISRVLGLVRDMAIGAFIPLVSRDAFIVAFRLPNMLRDLVGEGASNAAFIPLLAETLETESEDEFRRLVSALMSAMIVILGAITLLGVLFLPYLFQLLDVVKPVTRGKGLAPEEVAQMISLARWTFPYIFFIGLTVFAMGPLFIKKHYATPSWSPALLNVSLIACCVALRGYFPDPAYALVLGVWLGGLAQLAVQYAALRRHAGVWRPNCQLRHPGIRAALWLLVPVLIGQAAGEVNKLVDTLFAAALGAGSVSALFYANRLVQLPLSVFGIATSAAILPTLSQAAARADTEDLRDTLMHGLRQSFFLTCPALIGLIVLRTPIILLLFQRGHFDAADATRTAAALAFYAAGLLSFAWVKVTVAGFYAVKDTKTPVIIASLSMLLNIVLNFALVGPMGFRGLALATTISFTVNFVLLYVLLCRRFGPLWNATFVSDLVRVVAATVAMGATLVVVQHQVAGLFDADTLLARFTEVAGPMAAAGLVYLLVCAALRVPELGHFMALLTRSKN